MKKILLLLAVIGIVFSSCNGKYTIAKRKYNKGYYVNRTGGNHANTNGLASNKSVKVEPIENKKVEITTIAKNESNIMPRNNNEPIIAANSIANSSKNTSKASINNKTTKGIASTNPIIVINKEIKPLDISKESVPVKKGGGDTNLIVLIILCFLWWLNLIAVYIHDGKDITLNFWITLLLDFTFIGGVIFSLLVVLDIVDLK